MDVVVVEAAVVVVVVLVVGVVLAICDGGSGVGSSFLVSFRGFCFGYSVYLLPSFPFPLFFFLSSLLT